jgi:hypothetical protein
VESRRSAFYVDLIGLIVSDKDNNTIYLRGVAEICHHSLVLKRASAPQAERVRFAPFGLPADRRNERRNSRRRRKNIGAPGALLTWRGCSATLIMMRAGRLLGRGNFRTMTALATA